MRELKKVGMLDLLIEKKKPFVEWVKEQMDEATFMGLSAKSKREIFLRWKHGFTSNDANESVEATEREITKEFEGKDLSGVEEGMREFIILKLQFDEYCRREWRRISGDVSNPEVQKYVTEFNGRVV